MSSSNFKPWWERANEYLSFDERKEFIRGYKGYRPNNPTEVILGLLSAGYVRNKFEKPQSHTGKKKQ